MTPTNQAERPPLAISVAAVVAMAPGQNCRLIGAGPINVRLKTFYARVHPPTLGTTLGTACIAMASMVSFSVLQTRPVLHEIVLVLFILVTTPVTLTLLVRAALFRDEVKSDEAKACADPDRTGIGTR